MHAHHSHGATDPSAHAKSDVPGGLKDPVCGMAVTTESVSKLEHDGRPYYFCSAGCQARFAADPLAYIGKQAALMAREAPEAPTTVAAAGAAAGADAGAIYTCPMHPEIRQDHPGDCPKCGMTLEPLLPTLDDEENPELVSFQRRFWWTLPLTVVVTVLAMFGHRFGWFEMATQSWIEMVLSLPVVLWAGWPFFVRGAQSVVQRSPNM